MDEIVKTVAKMSRKLRGVPRKSHAMYKGEEASARRIVMKAQMRMA